MTWLFPRFLSAALAMALGALLGHFGGDLVQAPWAGSLLGAAGGAGLASLLDTLSGYRLIHWLSGSQEQAAPRDTGFWGEIGYRVERAIRQRERGAAL